MTSSLSGSAWRTMLLAVTVAAAGVAPSAGAMGQEPDTAETHVLKPIRGSFFISGGIAAPVGEFREHVDLTAGAGGGFLFPVDGYSNVALRAEANFVIYGSRSYKAPLGPEIPFGKVNVQTTNSIFSVGLGPQVFLGGGALRPYFFGTVGLASFATRTRVSGSNHSEDFLSRTNYLDFDLNLTGGGGLSIQLRTGERPVSLNLSASYHYHGPTRYLTGGDRNLDRLSNGAWRANPISSDANLMSYRVALSWWVR